MNDEKDLTSLEKELEKISIIEDKEKYKKFNLSFNPFPKAGAANINSSDYFISKLKPIDGKVNNSLIEYIRDSLFSSNPQSDDKFISAVIRGNYGSGKTQMLLYIKYLLELVQRSKKISQKP